MFLVFTWLNVPSFYVQNRIKTFQSALQNCAFQVQEAAMVPAALIKLHTAETDTKMSPTLNESVLKRK